MPMTAKGLAKLIEECGELQQVCGKRLAYYTTDDHPDGSHLPTRMQEEMGDVLAAMQFVAGEQGLDWNAIQLRANVKGHRFLHWHGLPDNNVHGVDAQPLNGSERA